MRACCLRSGTVPLSPRKPLVWSEGLVKGARVFVEDSESPYANQYGQIVEVRYVLVVSSLVEFRDSRFS
jgi:hypothetical protein